MRIPRERSLRRAESAPGQNDGPKATPDHGPGRLAANEVAGSGAVEDVRADLLTLSAAGGPTTARHNRRDTTGRRADARDDIGHGQPGDRPGPGAHAAEPASTAGNWPWRTNENCAGCLTTPHQLGGYLPEAARFMTTRATASWPSSGFAARFEIDRGREAVGLVVERSAGAVAVDQRVERPAAACRATRPRSRSTALSLTVTDRAGCAWITAPSSVATALVAATAAGRATGAARRRAAAADVDVERRPPPDVDAQILGRALARTQRQHEQTQ